MNARSSLPLLLVLSSALATACSAPATDDASGASSSEDALTGVTSYASEARFSVPGEPVRVMRVTVELPKASTASSSVVAQHVTTYDEGSFRHDSCTTSITFPGATAAITVLDEATGATVASYTRPLDVAVGFETGTDQGSTCYPHQYPSLAQDASLYVRPDAIAFPDGAKLADPSFSFAIHVTADRQGDAWKLTSASLDPLANVNEAVYYQQPDGHVASTALYPAGKRSPHTISARAELASCALTDGEAGDPQSGTVHFAFDYVRSLEAGAKVLVKYAEVQSFVQAEPTWSDAKQVELTRAGNHWKGEITEAGKLRVVKGYPDGTQRDAVVEVGTPGSLLYVFHVVHADGTESWENGSSAKWGNYRTQGNQGGRWGHYGLLVPASCDGTGREANIDVSVEVHR